MSEEKLCPFRQGFEQTTVPEWGPEKYTTVKAPFPGNCLQDKCAMWRNEIGYEKPDDWAFAGYCGLAGKP